MPSIMRVPWLSYICTPSADVTIRARGSCGAQIDPGVDVWVAILLPERFGVIGEIAAHGIAQGWMNGEQAESQRLVVSRAAASAGWRRQPHVDEGEAGRDGLAPHTSPWVEQGLQPEASIMAMSGRAIIAPNANHAEVLRLPLRSP